MNIQQHIAYLMLKFGNSGPKYLLFVISNLRENRLEIINLYFAVKYGEILRFYNMLLIKGLCNVVLLTCWGEVLKDIF